MKKISLITVTYNAENTLKPTIESVLSQSYKAIEHIIIDGASTDNTAVLAKDYMERSLMADNGHEVRLLIEPDNGIYDAMNKGLHLATGDYVCFLNAGDSLHSPDTIASLVKATGIDKHESESKSDKGSVLPAVLYGNTDIVDGNGNFLSHRRLQPPEQLSWQSFKSGMLVCHQAFYARMDIAKETLYDLAYRYSADFDWCIRIMKKAEEQGLPLANSHLVLANYLNEGATTRHHKASLLERYRIMRHYYGRLSTFGMHLWFILRAAIKR